MALALKRQIGADHAAAEAALKHLIAKWADAAPYPIAVVYALRRDYVQVAGSRLDQRDPARSTCATSTISASRRSATPTGSF